MAQSPAMLATILASSAPAYAAYATSLLVERRPEVQELVGRPAFTFWKDELQQRVLELSAAISEQEPQLFVSRIHWIRQTSQPGKFSDDMLRASLECLAEVLEEELPPSKDRKTTEYLELALATFDAPPIAENRDEQTDDKSDLANRYLDLVLGGDSRAAIDLIVGEGLEKFSIEELYFDVLFNAQTEIGTRWHLGKLRIAEEHHVTATTQRAMAILSHLASPKPLNGLTVVSAAVSGNAHDIGIRAVAYFFELAGWRSVCLGGDSPPAEIANAVQCFDADLLLVSAALSTQVKAVRDSIAAVRADSPTCKILVGGLVFSDAPELWKRLQADGSANDATKALEIAEELTSKNS